MCPFGLVKLENLFSVAPPIFLFVQHIASRSDSFLKSRLVSRVTSYGLCLITFEHNRYRVPVSFANRVISLWVHPQRLVIVAEAQMAAEHIRVFRRDKSTPVQTVFDRRHRPPCQERRGDGCRAR